MKTFEVELRRTSYIVLTIDAENEDDAEAKAWEKIKYDPVNDDDEASWEVESIERVWE